MEDSTPKYIVKDAHIRHAPSKSKEAKTYGPGDEIELTEAEALALGGRVLLAKPSLPAATAARAGDDGEGK